MTKEEKKAVKWLENISQWFCCEEPTILLKLIEGQEQEIYELKALRDMACNRKYHKKYLEERRKKEPNLLYPDADEIYERYYEQKAEIQLKDKVINEMVKYISGLDIEEDICNNTGKDLSECDSMNFGECEHCIMEYFINKAKEEM